MTANLEAIDILVYYLTQAGDFGDRNEIEAALEDILANWKDECSSVAHNAAKEHLSKQNITCCQHRCHENPD